MLPGGANIGGNGRGRKKPGTPKVATTPADHSCSHSRA